MTHLDSLLFLWLNAAATTPPWVLQLALFSSQELPALLIAGTMGAALAGGPQMRRNVVLVLLAMGLAFLVARLGQHLLHVQRPFVVGLGTQWLEHGRSGGFPSTHASVAFAFAAAVALVTRSWIMAAAALALAGLIAWSRVCLGLHFPSDILAGLCVGLLCAWVVQQVPGRKPRTRPVY